MSGNKKPRFLYYLIGYDHSTLLLNNLNRGPDGDSNVIEDYSNLNSDQLRAWFLPEHGRHTLAGTHFHTNFFYIFIKISEY